MISVSNYFKPALEDAGRIFALESDRVVVQAGSKEDDRWIEVMHEMRPFGGLCAIVEANGDVESLRSRLVSLCVAGVEEITFVGTSHIEVEECISLSRAINRDERLGLKIFGLN